MVVLPAMALALSLTLNSSCDAAGQGLSGHVFRVARVQENRDSCDHGQFQNIINRTCETHLGTAFAVSKSQMHVYLLTAAHVVRGDENGGKLGIRQALNCYSSGIPPDYLQVNVVSTSDEEHGEDIALLSVPNDGQVEFDVLAISFQQVRRQGSNAFAVGYAGYKADKAADFYTGRIDSPALHSPYRFTQDYLAGDISRQALPGLSGSPVVTGDPSDVNGRVIGLFAIDRTVSDYPARSDFSRNPGVVDDQGAQVKRETLSLPGAGIQPVYGSHEIFRQIVLSELADRFRDRLRKAGSVCSSGSPRCELERTKLANAVRDWIKSRQFALEVAVFVDLMKVQGELRTDLCTALRDNFELMAQQLEAEPYLMYLYKPCLARPREDGGIATRRPLWKLSDAIPAIARAPDSSPSTIRDTYRVVSFTLEAAPEGRRAGSAGLVAANTLLSESLRAAERAGSEREKSAFLDEASIIASDQVFLTEARKSVTSKRPSLDALDFLRRAAALRADLEAVEWANLTKSPADCTSLDQFLRRFSDGKHADSVRAQRRSLNCGDRFPHSSVFCRRARDSTVFSREASGDWSERRSGSKEVDYSFSVDFSSPVEILLYDKTRRSRVKIATSNGGSIQYESSTNAGFSVICEYDVKHLTP